MARPETESNETSGWPLGLQIMNLRLRVMEIANHPTANRQSASNQPDNLFMTSSSFSSFSSSNLDTESTASFFQDNSISLGRLIGFRAVDHRRSNMINGYFPRRNAAAVAAARLEADCEDDQIVRMSTQGQQGICIPLILSTIDKINRRKGRPN